MKSERVIWAGMKRRCSNRNVREFRYYGGRGIRVCERWLESFEAFLADMGPRPSSKHSLDRIDNDGDYEPGNCRWATRRQQANNRRGNRLLTINGVSMTAAAWARAHGISRQRLNQRLKAGFPIDRALSQDGVGTRRCGGCGEPGHYVRTCPQARAAATEPGAA